MTVLITDAAINKFRILSQSRYPKIDYPRIEIKSGGCQGFEKSFSFDIIRDVDIMIKHDDVNILIDENTFSMLETAIVDYKSDISGSKFTIDIPTATSTCGCGTSFSL